MQVYKHAAEKLKQRDDPCTQKHLLCGNTAAKGTADTADAKKAEPAKQKHADVRIPAI